MGAGNTIFAIYWSVVISAVRTGLSEEKDYIKEKYT
jgi:hypothetical protein